MQTSLFEDNSNAKTEKELPKELPSVSWSFSKVGTLTSCPRKYYYQYFGSNKLFAKEDSNKERLIYLSQLSTRHMVPGNIIHDVIAIYFRNYKKGNIWEYKKMEWLGLQKLADAFKHSEDEKNAIHQEHQYPPYFLKELYYSLIPTEKLREELAEKIVTCLKNFYNSTTFEHLRNGAKQNDSLIEYPAKLNLSSHIKVSGKVDIAFPSSDEYFIGDWKTGKSEYEETSLQLLVYALWAIENRGIDKSKIKIQKAYLHNDTIEELEFSEKHLLRARVRIMQDSQSLSAMNSYGKRGIPSAFTKCNQ